MRADTPFSLNRFEHEHTHHYYLPEHVWAVLEGWKSVVLLGSRGTGKTTLLRALNWEEQIANSFLASQLRHRVNARSYLGVYVKLSLFQLGPFRQWPSGDVYFRAAVTSLYVDLLWIEALCDAVAHLLANRALIIQPRREFQATAAFMQTHPELLHDQPRERISFAALNRIIFERRSELERLAIARSDIQSEILTRRFPLRQVGEVGRTFAASVTACLPTTTPQDPWRVKVCFDEAECLDSFQQKVINTAIRLSNANLAYIVSYVRSQDEPNATVLPNITLQRADREIVPLDAMDDGQFTELVEGVSKVRLQAYGAGEDVRLDLTALLGRLDINEVLRGILMSSEDPEAARLLALADRLRGVYDDTDADEQEGSGGAAPIYQAYLVDRLGLAIPDSKTPKKRRAQDSAELRKRMVAAYLCLCAELGTQVRYAYAEMVLQMSDKCVRDYLLQMDELYRTAAPHSVADFLRMKLPLPLQHEALRRAAVMKREYVPESGVGAPTETLRLVETLGIVTARLQATRHKQLGLRSSERGVFVISMQDAALSTERDRLLQLIVDAADAGFLKLVSRTDAEWKLRVHCSLAAAFGFSYRGAYYPVPIRVKDLVAISTEQDTQKRQALVASYERWIGTDAAAELPLLKELM